MAFSGSLSNSSSISAVPSAPVGTRRYFSTKAVTPLATSQLATSIPSLLMLNPYRPPPGAMITASHNPKGYNGIKLCLAGAAPVGIDTGLREIQELAEGDLPERPERGEVVTVDALPGYVDHLLSIVDADRIGELKVVADGGNGVAGVAVPSAFERVPARLTGKPFWDVYVYQDPPLWKAYIDACKYFDIDGGFELYQFGDLFDDLDEHWEERIVHRYPDGGLVTQSFCLESGQWNKYVRVHTADNPPARTSSQIFSTTCSGVSGAPKTSAPPSAPPRPASPARPDSAATCWKAGA